MFDLSSLKSFEDLKHIHQKALDIAYMHHSFPLVSILLGNKCDLENERKVSKKEAEDFAQKIGSKYFEISAKNNANIEKAFEELIRKTIRVKYPFTKEDFLFLENGGKFEKKKKQNCITM